MIRNRRALGVVAIAVLCAAIFACGETLTGRYEAAGDASGAASVEFKGDKAYLTIIGVTTVTEYEVDGDKVIFKNSGGNGQPLVMTIEKDGSLTGPLGLKLKKQS